MKTGKTWITVCIMLSICGVLVIHPNPISTDFGSSNSIPAVYQLNRIVAESNEELVQYSTSGTGSENDPYILSDLEVISSYLCVDIQNTNAFFIMRGCKLICTDDLTPVILLNEVENGAFENCTIRGGNNAVECQRGFNINLTNCHIFDSPRGIHLEDTESSNIQGCKIFSNSIGILFQNSDGSEIVGNSIYSNSFLGLYINENSNNNTIYLNKFGWNEENAVAHGSNNQFFHPSGQGNVWSDYNDSEEYTITGIGNYTDPFADLLVDSENPVIDHLDDVAIDSEDSNRTIEWTPSDEFPVSYTITVDEYITLEDIWDGGEIEYTISQLPLGSHVIEILVSDAAENTATDQIYVSVLEFMIDDIGTIQLVVGSCVTVALFFMVIAIIKRRD